MIEKTNRCRYINDLGWECCSLLNVEECPENCKFRKTEEEYQEGQRHARSILDAKGLEVCDVFDSQGVHRISTQRAK